MHSHEAFGGSGHRWGGSGKRGFLGRLGGFINGGQSFRAARMLDCEDLQLLILAFLSEKPRHGYDLIKAFEEQSSGLYTPSPGVIYPALTYLEETGQAVSEMAGNKKLYALTEAGQEQFAKNRELVTETREQLSRLGRKMARMQRHFQEDEAENEFDESDSRTGGKSEWRRMRFEFRELIGEFKTVLREKSDAPLEEKKRVLEVMRQAVAAIRQKQPDKSN